ncbi:MAG: hypothetical protein MZV70_52340 [Desulfobacterales bacterium]|nr:hypothetical protein [Desulfobacterales bacterium]
MDTEGRSLSALVKEIRRQLALSQEDSGQAARRQLRDRHPMGKRVCPKPSKLAKAQLEGFCKKMTGAGQVDASGG